MSTLIGTVDNPITLVEDRTVQSTITQVALGIGTIEDAPHRFSLCVKHQVISVLASPSGHYLYQMNYQIYIYIFFNIVILLFTSSEITSKKCFFFTFRFTVEFWPMKDGGKKFWVNEINCLKSKHFLILFLRLYSLKSSVHFGLDILLNTSIWQSVKKLFNVIFDAPFVQVYRHFHRQQKKKQSESY